MDQARIYSDKESIKLAHPKQKANFLSNLFFCWTFPSLAKGFNTHFQESDLFPPLPQHESQTLGDKLERVWTSELLSKRRPSLWRAFFKIFGKEFLVVGIIVFFNEFLVRLSQPVLIWKLITSHTNKKNNVDENEAYICAFLIIVSSFTGVILFSWSFFTLREIGMKIRISCSSIIYRKALKLNKTNLNKTATGQIINLLSNDLNRFDKLFVEMHYLWAAPLEFLTIIYLLYIMLDSNALSGSVLFVIIVPAQVYMGKKYSDYRVRTANKTDERVRLINEIFSGIQVIKMYTWEKIFIGFANNIRKQEVKYIRKTSYLKTVQSALNVFLNKAAIYVCIVLYVLNGNHLQSQYVFVIKSFYNLLQQSMTTHFPEALKNIAEASVSVKRLEQFLLSDEIKKNRSQEVTVHKGVFTEKLTTQWPSSALNALSEIDFQATTQNLVTIVGNVGCGKTTLIKTILQELPLQQGKLIVEGQISYACQEPWLMAGTIKQNILFGQKFDKIRYNKVVKACALSPDFKLLAYGENSIVGDKGITLSGGQKARISLARAVYRNADIYVLDDPLASVDASVGQQIFNDCILNFLKTKCVILATHQIQFLEKSDKIYVMESGKIVSFGSYNEIQSSGHAFVRMLSKNGGYGDEIIDDSADQLVGQEQKEIEFHENQTFGGISWKAYGQYLLSHGWLMFSAVIAMLVISQAIQSVTDYFEAFWVNLEESSNKDEAEHSKLLTTYNCIYIYLALILVIFLMALAASISFYAYFMNTSIKLHNRMFSAVIQATMNFFYTNPSGTILNRFSKDIGNVDTSIPKYFMDTLEKGFSVLAAMLLVSIVNYWMLITSTIILLLFYILRTIYVTTAREIKRIEAASRSPVYSHLNETLQGLETVRIFGNETKRKEQFDQLLNQNTAPFYMSIALFTTFSFWLDFFCSVYISLVTASCFWGKGAFGSDMGLVITQATSLGIKFQWAMTQWSEFNNEMISVERITQYIDTETEENITSKKSWPTSNRLEFKSITLKYKKETPAALDNLSFAVAPNEKIGIVGRTGAGKSSLISILFRLVKFEGTILIGNVDIQEIPLSLLRSKISIIPQDPVLFSGTIRNNLDPFNQFSDFKLWNVLEEVELKLFVQTLPEGIESRILENGSNLSVGQRQLFCLARALLEENHILVLDEATANVDVKTDFLIKETITKRMENCTVLIVAHRLHTVINCDKIIVMDAGKIVEFDHPYKLLTDQSGALYDLAAKSSHNTVAKLTKIAKKNYEDSIENSKL